MQLEDEDWLVKSPLSAGAYAANFNDEEWLVTPLKHSGVMNGIDREDEEWLVKVTQLSGAKDVDLEDEEWLVKSGQPITNDALDSDFRFIHEFSEQGAVEPMSVTRTRLISSMSRISSRNQDSAAAMSTGTHPISQSALWSLMRHGPVRLTL